MPDSKPSWSQGEWRADGLNVYAGSLCIHTDCGVGLPGYANADLIAAAPALYTALEELTKRFRVACLSFGADQDFVEEAVAKYDAILAAARGEG